MRLAPRLDHNVDLSLRLAFLPLSLGALSVFAGTPLQRGCASQCIAQLGFVRIHIQPFFSPVRRLLWS